MSGLERNTAMVKQLLVLHHSFVALEAADRDSQPHPGPSVRFSRGNEKEATMALTRT